MIIKILNKINGSIEILAFAALACLLGPLGFFRGAIPLRHLLGHFCLLVPKRMGLIFFRGLTNWRLGDFALAIIDMESLIGFIEENFQKTEKKAFQYKKILEDLYTVLTRAYLHMGQVDDAMLAILRAKKSIGLTTLKDLPDLDFKTAHVIRAGLAASRMLGGDGLTTLLVRSEQTGPENRNRKSNNQDSATILPEMQKKERTAKIIPFPGQKHIYFN